MYIFLSSLASILLNIWFIMLFPFFLIPLELLEIQFSPSPLCSNWLLEVTDCHRNSQCASFRSHSHCLFCGPHYFFHPLLGKCSFHISSVKLSCFPANCPVLLTFPICLWFPLVPPATLWFSSLLAGPREAERLSPFSWLQTHEADDSQIYSSCSAPCSGFIPISLVIFT